MKLKEAGNLKEETKDFIITTFKAKKKFFTFLVITKKSYCNKGKLYQYISITKKLVEIISKETLINFIVEQVELSIKERLRSEVNENSFNFRRSRFYR